MTFDELKRGTVFKVDGVYYEAKQLGKRIVVGYLLEQRPGIKGLLNTYPLTRALDPEDLTGYQYLTECFSDLRFNRNNASAEECANYFELLKML